MTQLRCKAGDLCIVVGGNPDYLGKIFTVTSLCTVHKNHWDTSPPVYVKGYDQPMSFADSTLKPIRDQDDEDECLHSHIRKETHEQQKAAGLAALQHFGVKL